jgi:hypothetical protein
MKSLTYVPASTNCDSAAFAPPIYQTARWRIVRLVRNSAILSLTLFCFLIGQEATSVQAQPKKAKIVITSPQAPAGTPIVATGNVVYLQFTVNDPEITFVKFRITTDVGDAGGFVVKVETKKTDYSRYVPLFKGANTIELYAVKGDAAEKTSAAKLGVGCNDPSCYTALPPTALEAAQGETPPNGARNVAISRPTGGESATDTPTIERTIAVQKTSGIKKVTIDVTNGDKSVDHQVKPLEDFNDTLGYVKVTVKVNQGKNVIRAYSLETLGEKANQDAVEVTLTCTDAKCGKGSDTTAAGDNATKKGDITILQPTDGYPAGDVSAIDTYLSIAKDSKITKLQYEVFYREAGKNKRDGGEPFDVPAHPDKAAAVTQRIKLHKGDNTIRFFDPDNPANSENQVAIKVTNCSGDKCLKAGTESTGDVARNITIDDPKIPEGLKAYPAKDKSSIDSYVTVAQGSGIEKIQYDVFKDGKRVYTSDPQVVDVTAKAAKVPISIKFLKGLNTIRIYDAGHPGGNNDATIDIDCTGNCATDLNVATIVTNSQNTRIIVGLEQAGASSSKSETKPFLDFFFTTPILFGHPKQLVATTEFDDKGQAVLDNEKPRVVWIRKSIHGAERDDLGLVATMEFDNMGHAVLDNGKPKVVWVRKSVLGAEDELRVPRAAFWGEVRLASTPEQITTTGILPTNLVNLVGNTGSATNLVQSFDFLAGLEFRLFTANGSFLSLIPGIKQKTRFNLAGGFGAISPLDATQENPKFFLIPKSDSSQRTLFEQRYGKPPDTATHVALVPLERDRFFRQWYLGIRLKTFYCDRDPEGNSDCHRFRNSFPAIVDFMIGQNQSVTGGSFKRTTIDPTSGNAKTQQAFVFRLDAFYPLPFREASFIYFYGTAMMKIGGTQKIDNFLVLDSASSTPNINDPSVYVPSVDFMRGLQSNRDYYKIGVGINLTDFFNRNKPKD